MGREAGLFLDTNVLYGAFECDLFLGIAESGYLPISVHWSDFVLMELRTHLTERLKQLKPGLSSAEASMRAENRIRTMNLAFPDACTTEWRRFLRVANRFVSDPDDAPVLAGAIRASCRYLVTSNVSDFDVSGISSTFKLNVIRPGEMLCVLYSTEKEGTIRALESMMADHRRPPRTLRELVDKLNTMESLRSFSGVLESALPSDRERGGGSGYQPRDSLGRFARKIGGYGYDGDLADPDGWR